MPKKKYRIYGGRGGLAPNESDIGGLLDQINREINRPAEDDPFVGQISGETQIGIEPRTGPGGIGPPQTVDTVTNVLREFYRLRGQRSIMEVQAVLYAGGFYGATDINSIQWGVQDDASFAAWASAVEASARQHAAGTGLSINDVLRNAAVAGGIDPDRLENLDVFVGGIGREDVEELDPEAGEIIRREGDVITTSLSDPSALRKTIDDVATATLGRKANADEQRMFIGFMHNLQRAGQRAQQQAEPGAVFDFVSQDMLEAAATDPATAMALEQGLPEPEDVFVDFASPDPTASAEQLLRQQNPAEAGAHDIAIQYASLLDLLPGPIPFDRQVYNFGRGGF